MKNNKRTNNNKQRIKIPQSTNVYEKKNIYKDHVYQVENHKSYYVIININTATPFIKPLIIIKHLYYTCRSDERVRIHH